MKAAKGDFNNNFLIKAYRMQKSKILQIKMAAHNKSRLRTISFILLIWSCCSENTPEINKINVGNYDLSSVYEQKIPNSSKALYKFYLTGNITGSTFHGITLLDTITPIKKSYFGRKLPFSHLKKMPQKDSVNIIKLVDAKDNYNVKIKPLKRKSIVTEGIPFEIEYREKYTGYGTPNCFLENYSFEEIKESKDSIHLYGLKSKFVNVNQNIKQLSFLKGNIQLIENQDNKLNKIIITKLLEEVGNEIIFNKKSQKYGKERKSINIVCIKTYYFEPVSEVLISSFSDYGFYKKKK